MQSPSTWTSGKLPSRRCSLISQIDWFGDGHRTGATTPSQPTSCYTPDRSPSVATLSFGKLGLRSESRSSFGSCSEGGTGPMTVVPDMALRPDRNATSVIRNRRQLITSYATAPMHARCGFISIARWIVHCRRQSTRSAVGGDDCGRLGKARQGQERFRLPLRSYRLANLEGAECSLLQGGLVLGT